MVIPLFKSHCSIGKSILTLDIPKTLTKERADSIFSIAQEEGLQDLFLVEDSLIGFLQALNTSKDLGFNLRFGLRLSMVDSLTNVDANCLHKIVIFARNSDGCKKLNQIYSFAFTEGDGRIDTQHLKNLWDEDGLRLAIPFYDSFIFQNLFSFSSCVPDFSFTQPYFFIEDNTLPFDGLLAEAVTTYANNMKAQTVSAKSIFYKKRADFEAFQTYKCICSRQSFRKPSLDSPNLDHCGSAEFSVESWKEVAQS
tara:strand:- start:1675 stop:2433 length:759 start_codon:yes stop_codon:yes gene_type:complete